MENIQKVINYIWLLNAEVNSLNEPRILAEDCIRKIDEIKEISLSPSDIEIFKKEISNSLSYLRNMKEVLGELEKKVNILMNKWAGGE